MNHYGRLRRAAIGQGIPEDEIERFAKLLRFSIWTNQRLSDGTLVGHPHGLPTGHTTDVLVGRAGGLPSLPVDMEWPAGPGGPLPFVAAFDCAALPQVDGFGLPPDGSLLVFLHHEDAYGTYDRVEEQGHARIVYVPAGIDTVVAAEPDHMEPMFDATREFIAPQHDLFAVVHAHLPGWLDKEEDLSDFQKQLVRDLPHRRELSALVRRLWPGGTYAAFQFGGYTKGIGEMYTEHLYTTPDLIMAEESLEAREQAGDPVVTPEQRDYLLEEELHRVWRDWLPLVQFDPGDDVYRGRFLIRVEDLAARRFDQALSFTAFLE